MPANLLEVDTSDMLGKVASLPDQLEEGLELAKKAWKGLEFQGISSLVVAGMGGSAIGGDLLRSYLGGTLSIPLEVCRYYHLPAFVGSTTLVVLSSYSGNTEETLSCFEDALRRSARIVCVSSNGKLIKEAERHGCPFVRIPSGIPPRAALGYSFAPLLALVWALGLCEPEEDALSETVGVLRRLREDYGKVDEQNKAFQLANVLKTRFPIIYSSVRIQAVGVRWKGQFSENSKKLAMANVLPEMNHNEIMGWEVEDQSLKPGVILLRLNDEHPQVRKRFDFLKGMLEPRGYIIGEYTGEGLSLLSQMFSLIMLGDFASVYLALLRGVDPTPVGTIERLKVHISKRD